MDQFSTRAQASDLAASADANWQLLRSIWWRWLGPMAVLGASGVFFALALTRAPSSTVLIPLCGLAAVGPATEAPFLTENDAAMSTMLTGMTVQPTGDVDRDFVAMMIPHHQGAIAMAQALLRYGHNVPLRRMAQEIIVTQLQKIAAMRLAVGEPLPPSIPSPDQLDLNTRSNAHPNSQQ